MAQSGHHRSSNRRRMHPRFARPLSHPHVEERQREQQRRSDWKQLHRSHQSKRLPNPQRLGKESTDPARAGLPSRSSTTATTRICTVEGKLSIVYDPAAAATTIPPTTSTTTPPSSASSGATFTRSPQHCLLAHRAKDHPSQEDHVEQELHFGQKSSPSTSLNLIIYIIILLLYITTLNYIHNKSATRWQQKSQFQNNNHSLTMIDSNVKEEE